MWRFAGSLTGYLAAIASFRSVPSWQASKEASESLTLIRALPSRQVRPFPNFEAELLDQRQVKLVLNPLCVARHITIAETVRPVSQSQIFPTRPVHGVEGS
jgi:hypothetical protein